MRRLALVLLLGTSAPALAQSVQDRARTAAAASAARTGDSDTLLHNYVTPGMSGQPVTTVDGAVSFTPSISCQKTASLLELLVQPGSTGDIDRLVVSQDTDFDGSFDKSSTLPVQVSGICANGVISCQPGTWNQCNAFKWDVGSDHALKLTQVDLPALAGCYCINNSCGTNLAFGNLNEVLKDLGGGMIGALTSVDPRFGVAQAQINGPVIDYVGAQTTSCAQTQAVSQTSYATNPTTITGDASNAASGNTVFQMLKGSPAGAGKAEETRACSITREITLSSANYDDTVAASGSLLSLAECGDGCRNYQFGGNGNCNDPPATYTLHFTALKPERIVSARIVQLHTDDWEQARVNGQPVASAGEAPWLTNSLPGGSCGTGDDFTSSPNFDFTDQLKAGDVTIDVRIRATGSHKSGWGLIQIQTDTSCRTAERLVDLCAGYAGDAACRLNSEDVDGVFTFRNGVGTGLKPLQQTRAFGSDSCTVELTRDFFERDRSYKCSVDTSGMPQPDLSRGAYIIDHSTETLLADQTEGADGTVSQTTSAFSLPDRGSVSSCEAVCKTRAPKVNTAAAQSGVVGTQQNDPSGWDTFYHVCSASNVCPTGPGEEIVSGCGCLDDFPEAVVMMQSVRLAGTDMVCTSATP